MSPYIAADIEKINASQGLPAAQDRYRAWFMNTSIYARYKASADTTLIADGHGDIIVTE